MRPIKIDDIVHRAMIQLLETATKEPKVTGVRVVLDSQAYASLQEAVKLKTGIKYGIELGTH